MGAKKVKISSVKRSAHLRNKKSPINKQQQHRAAQQKASKEKGHNLFLEKARKRDSLAQKKKDRAHTNVNVDSDNDLDTEQMLENVADMLEDEDLDYLQEKKAQRNRKRKTEEDNDEDIDSVVLEKAYKLESAKEDATKKIKIDLLPIKSREGEIITRSTEVDIHRSRPKVTMNIAKESDAEIEEEEEDADIVDYEDSDDDILNDEESKNNVRMEPKKKLISTTDLLIARQQELERQKYRIGIICSGILEKPEDKMRNFNALYELMDEKNASGVPNLLTVRRVAMVSITEIFKDLLPEYRVGQVDTKMQTVRKSTLERVTYENSLLQQFKKFLQKLEQLTANVTKRGHGRITAQSVKMAEVAVQSMCDILIAHPYFNYVQNIAQLLVYMLNSNFRRIRESVDKCFRSLFTTDKRLDMTLFIVRRVNHLIKTKQHNVHLECVTCLLALKIKNVNLDAEKENELKQKKLEAHRQRLLSLSKKERKRRKKLAELNQELEETRAEENKQTKHYKLTEIIKMVFTIFFRILKNDPTSSLLSAVLEGLAEFTHIINFDFFSDLINVLNNILEEMDLGYREKLHCILTIFVILSGQGEAINIDPIRFYQHFFKNMFSVDAGKNHEDFCIILKTLNEVLVKRHRFMSRQRLIAFIKRLVTVSLTLLHNGTLATLGTIKTTFQLSSVLDVLLDADSTIGSGRYDPELNDPEYCNASCTALYELTLLTKHYHPTVRKMAIHIIHNVPASGEFALPPEIGKLNAFELFEQHDSTQMVFKPTIPVPRPTQPKIKKGRYDYINSDFKSICKDILDLGNSKQNVAKVKTFNFYSEINK